MPVSAILLFLAFSSVVFGQCPSGDACYTITGTLELDPNNKGKDVFLLVGTVVTASANISQTLSPSSSSTPTSTSSSNVYNAVPVQFVTVPINASISSTLTLTDNAGAPDTISIVCAPFPGDTLVATVTVPTGYMITDVPAAIPQTGITGTIEITVQGAANPVLYDIVTSPTTQAPATLVAAGTPPPAVTPSPAAWTPSAAQGSTTSLSQPISFTAPVAPAFVSFTTSTATNPTGQTWLSVTPSAANTSSSATITVNPIGLTAGTYTGTVFLNYGSSGVAATQIPVTFTISPIPMLTGPASMTFGYTLDTTPPGSQPLSIGITSGSATVNAAVTSGSSWLSVSPSSGTTPTSFTVSVNTAGVTTTLNGNIQITASGLATLNIPVTLNVMGPTLTPNPSSFTFNYQLGSNTQPPSQNLTVTGTPGINFTATPAGGLWLSVGSTTGTTGGSAIGVSVNTSGLAPETYNGTITIAATAATSQVVNVTLVVSNSTTVPPSNIPITEYPTPTTSSQPQGIVTGPDGALWFTESSSSKIGRITTAESFSEYTIPTGASSPFGIAAGPDGALWFTENASNKIGRITTAGSFTEYTIPTSSSHPYFITAGPDGALWFTEFSGNKIGQITTTGSFNEYPVLTASSSPAGITAGPDGALWFTENTGNNIGRITTGGSITEYPIPTSASNPLGISSGPDGALWFTEYGGNKVGRISTAGAITEYSVPTASSNPYGIAAGPDGALWVAEKNSSKIARVTIAGSVTEYATPTASSGPVGITSGPDSAIWFTESSVSQIGRAVPGLAFYTLPPCRVFDTRSFGGKTGVFGPPSIAADASRSIPIPSGSCNVPSNAQAYSLNVTVVPQSTLGYLTVWPTGSPFPTVSTLNALDGYTVANAAIVPAGTDGSISVFASNTTDVFIDINGYFAAPGSPQPLAFYPVPPCRVADTRSFAGFTGAFGPPTMTPGEGRDFPIISSSCNIPSSAQAYSLNMTVSPVTTLEYLTVWPTGGTFPIASTLNDFNGGLVANAALVPAGTDGDIEVFVTNATDVIIDINGYFAAPGTGGLSFYPLPPCRVADTRSFAGFTGAFGAPTMSGGSARTFPMFSSSCYIPDAAQAYALNMTLWPTAPVGFLTVWPVGQPFPTVSTLNSPAGQAVANAAIVPAGTEGAIEIFVSDTTDVFFDINGYFAP
jgi:virginiamycin B lyase